MVEAARVNQGPERGIERHEATPRREEKKGQEKLAR
jgi:hypothetical protein